MTNQDVRNNAEPTVAEQVVESTPGVNRTHNELEGALQDLFGVGRMWASHGLNLGKMALKHSARTLEVTASTLETIAKRLSEEPHSDDVQSDEATDTKS